MANQDRIEKNLKKIASFLNVSMDTITAQDTEIIDKMIQAVEDDDMFKVHLLGYSVKSMC